MIISHNNPDYALKHEGATIFNGAYYYSREIVDKFIPNIETDRNWVTINIPGKAFSHSIIFIHNNKNPFMYDFLQNYKDLVMVCGVPSTCDKVRHLGRAIYLPLSVDVKQVEKYKREKDKDLAYVGRRGKHEGVKFPVGTDFIEGVDRETLLRKMSRYKRVFAVGRTAIEAKILGCEVLPYDVRFPDPNFWQVVDSMEAVNLLQEKLNKIDRR